VAAVRIAATIARPLPRAMNKVFYFIAFLAAAAAMRSFIAHGYSFDREPGDSAMRRIAAQVDAGLPRKLNASVTLWAVDFEDKALQAYYSLDDYGKPDDGRIAAVRAMLNQLGCSGAWRPVIDAGYGVHASIDYVGPRGHATAQASVSPRDCAAPAAIGVRAATR
jgi:hypothetical protein